jgi:hypothetical protein
MAALVYPWPADLLARVSANPSEVLPMMLKRVAPAWVALLGLLAIVGAVTSSFSSSVLSAASMFSWNCCKRLLWPDLSPVAMKRLIRVSVAVLGGEIPAQAIAVRWPWKLSPQSPRRHGATPWIPSAQRNALRWMRQPLAELGERTPGRVLLEGPLGDAVEAILARIDYGVWKITIIRLCTRYSPKDATGAKLAR